MNLSPITVVMSLFIPPTEGGFSRLQGAKQTVLSWGRHLHYAGGLRLHIANDSTDLADSEVDNLAAFCSWSEVTIGHTRGRGLGGGFNAGMDAAFSDGRELALYADDSYSLVGDLDLNPWASMLLGNEHLDIGAVSLMPPRPGLEGGQCFYFYNIRTEGVAGMIFPKVGYVWNGRPLLYHKRFFDAYGRTLEDCSGYEWENEYSERYNKTPGPNVLFPFIDPWQHVWSGVRLGDKPPGWKG